jgi:hypothetical protein
VTIASAKLPWVIIWAAGKPNPFTVYNPGTLVYCCDLSNIYKSGWQQILCFSLMLGLLMISEKLNQDVLQKYLQLQDFSDQQFLPALRQFLTLFRLPGEAQKIDRIMNAFAQRYTLCNATDMVILDSDAAYILAFTIIMLNTDLHNPAVKNKMRRETFIKNNLDILVKHFDSLNANSKNTDDLIAERARLISDYLGSIYDEIKQQPLVLTTADEEDNRLNDPFLFTFFNPEREGWLIKQGGRIKTWKRRYCILTGSCLYYFKDEPRSFNDRDRDSTHRSFAPCGIIPLENLQVVKILSSHVPNAAMAGPRKKRYFFSLQVPDDPSQMDEENSESEAAEPLLYARNATIKAAKTGPDGRIVEGMFY